MKKMKKMGLILSIILIICMPVISYALTVTEAPPNTKTNRTTTSKFDLKKDCREPSMIWCENGMIVVCKKLENNRYKFLVRMDQFDSKIYKFLVEEE